MGLEDDGKGKYVTLVSADGFEYVVDYEAACVSKMIKNLMTSAGGFSELESNTITFPEISGRCLERVCQYFYYKLRHANSKDKLPAVPLAARDGPRAPDGRQLPRRVRCACAAHDSSACLEDCAIIAKNGTHA